jgi:hypothetical protein
MFINTSTCGTSDIKTYSTKSFGTLKYAFLTAVSCNTYILTNFILWISCLVHVLKGKSSGNCNLKFTFLHELRCTVQGFDCADCPGSLLQVLVKKYF